MSTTAAANPSFVPQSPSHWVPDAKRSSCKACHKDFTFFNRRHHCRSCREVFCSECSDFRLLTRDPKDTSVVISVRACHPCFDKFRGRKIRGQKKKANAALSAPHAKVRRNSKGGDEAQHAAATAAAEHQPLEVEMPTQHWEGEDHEITGTETIREEEDEDHHDYAHTSAASLDPALRLPSDASAVAVDRDTVMTAQPAVVLPSRSADGGLQFAPVDVATGRASTVSAHDRATLGAVPGSEEILHIPSDALASVKHSADSDRRGAVDREVGVRFGLEKLSLDALPAQQPSVVQPLAETRLPSVVAVSNAANLQGGLHTPVLPSPPVTAAPLLVGDARERGRGQSLVEVDDVSALARGQPVAVSAPPRHATPAAQTITSTGAQPSIVQVANPAALTGQRIALAQENVVGPMVTTPLEEQAATTAPSVVQVGSAAQLRGQRVDVAHRATVGDLVTSPVPERSLSESVVLVSDVSRLSGPGRVPVAVVSAAEEEAADLGGVKGSEEILHIPSDALASVKHSNMASLNKYASSEPVLAEKDEFEGRSVSAVEGSEEFLSIPSDALASVKHSELSARQQHASKEEGEAAWSDRNVENRFAAASPTAGVAQLFKEGGEQSVQQSRKNVVV